MEIAGKNVLVLGLGVNQGGIGVTRFLVEQGANVRVTDMQSEERLAGALTALEGLPVGYTLGRHDEADFEWAEIVVRNPGVPRESRWLQLARDRGARVEMEMTLFFRLCPASIIGVTGTKGKTTTATTLATLLRATWPDTVLAGNMGRSAVAELETLGQDGAVVIELSSFQLEALDEQGLAPHIAVLTNIGEDHLDRYGSMEEYAEVKGSIGRHQAQGDWLIVNRDDPRVQTVTTDSPARRVTFGRTPSPEDFSLWLEDGHFAARWGGERIDLGAVDDVTLRGEHSYLNVLAAMAAGLAFGASAESIRRALANVEPVPNRLETVATINGVEFVNDTTATVPDAAIAALRAFAGRDLVVIAGGSEKNVRLEPLASELAARARRVVLLEGGATGKLSALLEREGFADADGPYGSMAEAVERASAVAGPDSVVLLSPGCASFGMFQNEFHRGDEFRAAVERLRSRER